MTWFFLSLGTAFTQAMRNMVMKRLGHALDENINVWGRFTFLLPFAGLGVLYEGIPVLGEGFWWWVLAFGVSQCIATLSLSRAFKESDISLVTSLWKISLVFLLVWGFFVLGEQPNLMGVSGVLVSMLGVYTLNISRAHISWYAPLTAVIVDKGQRFALISAFFYAPSVVTIKQVALLSSPVFATFMGYLVASALITPYVLTKSARHFFSIKKHFLEFFLMGFFAAISSIMMTYAYTMTLSSYVEAVKQVEIFFALGIGYFVFHEKARVKEIWPASLLIFAGIVLVKLWG